MAFIKTIICWTMFIAVHCAYDLKHLKTIYVPFTYNPEDYQFDAGVVEQLAVDAASKYIYTIGNNMIHVIDMSDVENAELIYHIEVFPENSASIEDISICGEWVAINIDNKTSPLDGVIQIYTTYNSSGPSSMTKVEEFIVGPLPDSATFTKDCSKLLVILEGETCYVNGAVVDPEGGVTIIEFNSRPGSGSSSSTTIGFTDFNSRQDELIQSGVRKSYNGQGTSDLTSTTLSQDLEPESIVLNNDESIAYVVLQENNAIAVLDIEQRTFTDIHPLGSKNYAVNEALDASDKDGEINIRNYPIHAFYQPDGIKHITFGGESYLLLANEGDAREYAVEDIGMDVTWQDYRKGKTLAADNLLSDSLNKTTVEMLSNTSLLGHLRISVGDGLDDQNKIQTLYTFGGRSVTLYSTNPWSAIYDTGDDLERNIASKLPEIFNSEAEPAETLVDTQDTRSDNRGCEPESIETGSIGDDDLVFIGLERPGIIAVYSIKGAADTTPQIRLNFESLYYGGVLRSNLTWLEMYNKRLIHAIDPEDLKFVHATESPNGKPLLIAAGAVTGTVSILEVVDTTTENNDAQKDKSGTEAMPTMHLVMLMAMSSTILHFTG